jgi:hypothetical protein
LRPRAGVVRSDPGTPKQAFDIAHTPLVDRLHGGFRRRIDHGPAADRVFKRPLLAENPEQQKLKRIVPAGYGIDVGDNSLGGDIPPKLENVGLESLDVGEVPARPFASPGRDIDRRWRSSKQPRGTRFLHVRGVNLRASLKLL